MIKIRKHYVYWAVGSLCLISSALYYWYNSVLYPSTDDAYVNAHIVHIAPQVSGLIQKVYVKNDQFVSKGTALFQIDARPFEIAVAKARTNLYISQQNRNANRDAIAIAKANVEKAQTTLDLNQKTLERITQLVNSGRASVSQGDEAKANRDVAKTQWILAKNQLQKILHEVGRLDDGNAQVQAARASLAQAKLNLSYTLVTAPQDGIITHFNARVGGMALQGKELLSEIETQEWWVDANFKETQLERIRTGQSVKIQIDGYPGVRFDGIVESISGGTGSIFSIMPPENATGNWVKVTQRVPVKIKITSRDRKYPLRVGLSSQVEINTTQTPS